MAETHRDSVSPVENPENSRPGDTFQNNVDNSEILDLYDATYNPVIRR